MTIVFGLSLVWLAVARGRVTNTQEVQTVGAAVPTLWSVPASTSCGSGRSSRSVRSAFYSVASRNAPPITAGIAAILAEARDALS